MNRNLNETNPMTDTTNKLIDLVSRSLSPVAIKYGYADNSLDQMIKWKPIVLLLGNYSSGKSSLINELLGRNIQDTGQAPTDDSFTVITHEASVASCKDVEGTEILGDSGLPFQQLSKFGQRFTSHFKMKAVNAPILDNLALIDTPGMIDSVSEKDRGYDYQAVVGELASIADLIVVHFDPHRPGTVRETHELLRKTLPTASFENRTVFVLNRIDECENINDLLRTYGTLCWNLSQMTGRKDIPKIFLSYRMDESNPRDFLKMLGNQRNEVKDLILNAPQHRFEHLVSFTETHGRNLHYFLKILENYGAKRQKLALMMSMPGVAFAAIIGLAVWGAWFFGLMPELEQSFALGLSTFIAGLSAALWLLFVQKFFMTRFHREMKTNLIHLATIDRQSHGDSWLKVNASLDRYITIKKGRFSLVRVRRDAKKVEKFIESVRA